MPLVRSAPSGDGEALVVAAGGAESEALRAPELKRFEDALESRFRVTLTEDPAVDLTLVEVAAFPVRPGWEAFSLLFDGPSPAAFWHGMFLVEHAELGSFPLFLVAVHTDPDGQQYEAVFNRRLQ